MHSPRIRVPAQSARTTMYKSWVGAKPPKSSTSKPLQDEIEKFKILSRQCEEENRNLLNTLSAFNSINEIDSQTFLIDQFENELNQISKRIDKRSILINSIEKKSSRKKEAAFKNQDMFQEKTQLIAENEQLVNKALFLEKKMIAAKLKLRLNHDHRDFCRLKRQLSRLADDDDTSNDEEMEIYRNKEIIRNLKNAIEHEKARLLQINAPPTLEEEAAIIIQKIWRGYITRKSLSHASKPQNAVNNQTNSLKTDDPPFAELDNSDLHNEGNELQTNNEEDDIQIDNEVNFDQDNNNKENTIQTNEEENDAEDDTQIGNDQNDLQVNNEGNDNQINNDESNVQADIEESNTQVDNEGHNDQINEEGSDQIKHDENEDQSNNND